MTRAVGDSMRTMLIAARQASALFRAEPSAVARPHRSPALTFYGGEDGACGGRFLIETGTARVLVECGMFDGPADLRRRNWSPVPQELHGIDALVLTRADLAHCGYLPALLAEGWTGSVFVTPGTEQLLSLALTEGARLFAEDAADADALGSSEHHPALPPFREADLKRLGGRLRRLEFGMTAVIADGVHLEFGYTGRQLGSAWARLWFGDRSVVFCGELGAAAHPFFRGPQPRPDCDTLVLESAGGAHRGREIHPLAAVISRAAHLGGSVLMPVFAPDQTVTALMTLRRLTDAGAIPERQVYVDTPTGLAALDVYRQALTEGRPEIRPDAGTDIPIPARVTELRDTTGRRPAEGDGPSIILAGGGRAQRHLERMLPEPSNAVILSGYAAPDTFARQLADGVRQLKVRGRYVPVHAEISHLDGPGADAEQLQAWATAGDPPETTYLVHGQEGSAQALAKKLHADAGWCAVVPGDGERVLL